MDDVIDEALRTSVAEKKEPKNKHDNKNMKELQEEFDPKKSAVRKLRNRCNDYREDNDASNDSINNTSKSSI